jgi:hypothetical protein
MEFLRNDALLNYHTCIDASNNELINTLTYHTSIQSKDYVLENLSKYRLKETDIFTLAYLASHECLDESDREKYKYQLLKKLEENIPKNILLEKV